MKTGSAFLVRCWREGESEPPVWRFALLEIGATEQLRGFAEWEQLVRYLNDEIARNWLPAPTAANAPQETTANAPGKGDH